MILHSILVDFIHRGCHNPRCHTNDAVDFGCQRGTMEDATPNTIDTIMDAIKDHLTAIHGEDDIIIELSSARFKWDHVVWGRNLVEMKEKKRREQVETAVLRGHSEYLHAEFSSVKNPEKENPKRTLLNEMKSLCVDEHDPTSDEI